jgi:hypothetical protein
VVCFSSAVFETPSVGRNASHNGRTALGECLQLGKDARGLARLLIFGLFVTVSIFPRPDLSRSLLESGSLEKIDQILD